MPDYLRVREFGDDYWSKLRPKTIYETTRYLEKAWQPLHGEPVDQITRKMVKDRRDEIVSESGPTSANQALAALSSSMPGRSTASMSAAPIRRQISKP